MSGVVAFAVNTDAANRGPFRISYEARGGGRARKVFTSKRVGAFSSEGIVDVTSSDVRARGEVEIALNILAPDGSAISDVKWTGAEFVASSASISGVYGGDRRSLCSEKAPARTCTAGTMDFPTLADNARVLDPATRLDGSLEFTPPITGTVSFVIGASSTNHLLARRAVDGAVTVVRGVQPT